MAGDCHAGFFERLGVKFPLPVKLPERLGHMQKDRIMEISKNTIIRP